MFKKKQPAYSAMPRWIVYVLVFLFPIFFLPISTDVLEINKQTLLLILTLFAVLFWIISNVAGQGLRFRTGFVNILPVLLLLSTAVSAFFSQAPYRSWIGLSMQEYTSFLTMFGFALLFYLVLNTILSEKSQSIISKLIVISSLIVAIIGIFSFINFPVFPFAFTQFQTFNTIGTLNSFGIFAVATCLFMVGQWMFGEKSTFNNVFVALLSLSTIAVCVVINYWLLWLLLLGGVTFILIYSFLKADILSSIIKIALPVFLLIVSLTFLFWAPAIVRFELPVEVSPSFSENWNISKQTVANVSVWTGSGPGTYSFDFTKYHSADLNNTGLWNMRFDRAGMFMMLTFITTGFIGLVAWSAFLLIVLVYSILALVKKKDQKTELTLPAVFVAWLVLAVSLFLYSSNISLLFMFMFFSALLVCNFTKEPNEPKIFKRKHKSKIRAVYSVFLILLSIAFVSALFATVQRYIAEVSFSSAVKLDRQDAPIDQVAKKLDRAASYNKYNDVYLRNLSSALLLRVGDELDRAKTGEISADHGKLIQALVGASVNSAVRATQISPQNVLNWLVRGQIYRELITVVGNAGEFSIAAYEKAIVLEPNNPDNYLQLGKTYIQYADSLSPLLSAEKGTSQHDETEQKVINSFVKAEQMFEKALELKQDYAPAHFQLSIVLERQGRLDEAVGKMESVAKYNSLDVGVAFQLGMLYLRRDIEGDTKRAQESFENAIALAPSFSNARWFLASIYEKQGKMDRAIEQVSKVLEYDPENDLVKARLERLKEGKIAQELPAVIEEGEVNQIE
ncbi:MAG: tetratricopeptide repeat protein [Patescibacteria group bacterium]